jgi:hypothetical protein
MLKENKGLDETAMQPVEAGYGHDNLASNRRRRITYNNLKSLLSVVIKYYATAIDGQLTPSLDMFNTRCASVA